MTTSTLPTMPNVTETGKVMAELSDFQLIMYVLIVVIIVLVVERLWAGWAMRAEREKMWSVADKFGAASDRMAEQTNKLIIELQVIRALTTKGDQ